jgi:hypothetical protein
MFLLILKLDMFTLFVTTSRWWRISLSSVGGVPGGPPNRKQRREFVWSYGAPDSVGEKESVLKLLEEERMCDGTGVMMMMMGIFSEEDAAATAVIVVCLVGRAPRVVEGAWTTAIVPTASLGTQLPFRRHVCVWGGDAVISLGAHGEGQVCLFRRPHC